MGTNNNKKGADLSGLDNFNLSALMGGTDAKPKTEVVQSEPGSISYAPLDCFHEDPDNARKEFEGIEELAESMVQINPTTGKQRGILEPLSCARHPSKEGHYIILGGNRRFKAAAIAGLEELPFIIKEELDDFDKFVLNDQRENLSPFEVAMFIQNRLADGFKQSEIAKALGRQNSYISDHKIFFDMADTIRGLYDRKVCRSMQALALLYRAYGDYSQAIDEFCLDIIENEQEITTAQVRQFLASLKEPAKETPAPTNSTTEQSTATDENQSSTDGVNDSINEGTESENSDSTSEETSTKNVSQPSNDELTNQADALLDKNEPEKIKKAIVQVNYDDRPARLITTRRAAYGLAWIKYDDDGDEIEVDLNLVKLVAIIEG
ncbi:ParB/RepB/Spo0J family partition protein [Vibrio parahaemolyticus]|uniref:ParB/RepB/Spo0J family partition protein n=1 Tax=Vibrio parahaemolyticus TaxID=670 RepID=UPI00042622B4|nr:ParB/RepB/Spo0J family partition protein [Vibrio parahaemolyticus]HCE5184925.1 ParB/RepB/Spo0J family partition protein [Vibrio parahaemolyticus]